MLSHNECLCQFCGSNAVYKSFSDMRHKGIECPLCGKYIYDVFYEDVKKRDNFAPYLFYNKKVVNYFGDEKNYETFKKEYPAITVFRITPEIINSYKYMTFAEKINYLILYLGDKSRYMGDYLEIPCNEFSSAAFLHRFMENGNALESRDMKTQALMVIEYLNETELIKEVDYRSDTIFLCVSAKGWQLIETLQRNTAFGKKVFIAMSFADETKSTREALRKGIEKAGYTPVVIDEVYHNHQIVPEMFKQIRDSKFLVIDVSVPNNGAYYEAGYALGLGKEVIFCCKRETFDNKEKRPHFDVSQKQMIVWENENELSEKLEKWINSLFD